MPECIIVADDLTGGNGTGVLLSELGYHTCTVMNEDRLRLPGIEQYNCIVYPTDSRGVSADVAYHRVFNVTTLLKNREVKLYSKRIDSTLRGNLGSETDAMLNALGDDYVAIVAPCFPKANRILVGGYLLVNTVPLHKTEAAADPKTPVRTSSIKELYMQQSKYKIGAVDLHDLTAGKDEVRKKIMRYAEEGVRIITIDCISQEDLDLIADAVIESGIRFIAVDPGVFTATVAKKLITPPRKKTDNKILGVIGSVNPVTAMQMEELLLSQDVVCEYVNTKYLLDPVKGNAEILRVEKSILEKCRAYQVCLVVGDGIYPKNKISFEKYKEKYHCSTEALCNRINEAFAKITCDIVGRDNRFQGLYTSGGDITVAVSRKLNATGIQLLGEVVPLAAYGELVSGKADGMKIVTKGGMAGDVNALKNCINYLKEKFYMIN